MKATRLSKYRSKKYCNLDMFSLQPQGHMEKTWTSRDGRKHLISSMETSHLWNCFNMLMSIIESHEFLSEHLEDGPAWDGDGFVSIGIDVFINSLNEKEVASNALQYIGHELYKRGAQVPNVPDDSFRCNINRADNLQPGFVDRPGDLLNFK